MINDSLQDEKFIIESLEMILDKEKIERVKYHNKILFKVFYVIDRVYDYDDSEKVLNLINNIKEMSRKKCKKGIFEIQRKSGMMFYLDISRESIVIGKEILIKNRVKVILVIAVFIIINYIFNILNI